MKNDNRYPQYKNNHSSKNMEKVFYLCLSRLSPSPRQFYPEGTRGEILKQGIICPSCNNKDSAISLKEIHDGFMVSIFCYHNNNCVIGKREKGWSYVDFLKSQGIQESEMYSNKIKTKEIENLTLQFKRNIMIQKNENYQWKINKDIEACKTFKRIVDGKDNLVAKHALRFVIKDLNLDIMNNENDLKFVQGLFYCDEGDYKNRVIYPFYNKDGSIKFFQARAIPSLFLKEEKGEYYFKNEFNQMEKTPKYKNSRSRPLGCNNIDFIDITKPILAFESYNDSMIAENAVGFGQPGAIAKDFLNIIEMNENLKLYIILDNDITGYKSLLNKFNQIKIGIIEGRIYGFRWKKFLDTYKLKKEDFKDAKQLREFFKVKYLTYPLLKEFFTKDKEILKKELKSLDKNK